MEGINKIVISDNDVSEVYTCANCGKEGGSNYFNTCNKCKLVKYCNAACKKKHRKKHKKACEKRMAELHEEALFKEPPLAECSICCLPVLDVSDLTFKSCCGKDICDGCFYSIVEESFGRGKVSLCPYCRAPPTKSVAEENRRIQKCMDSGNSDAFNMMGNYYNDGSQGLRQDRVKAVELYLRAGELGCAEAYYNLGNAYRLGYGVEVDVAKAKHL